MSQKLRSLRVSAAGKRFFGRPSEGPDRPCAAAVAAAAADVAAPAASGLAVPAAPAAAVNDCPDIAISGLHNHQ